MTTRSSYMTLSSKDMLKEYPITKGGQATKARHGSSPTMEFTTHLSLGEFVWFSIAPQSTREIFSVTSWQPVMEIFSVTSRQPVTCFGRIPDDCSSFWRGVITSLWQLCPSEKGRCKWAALLLWCGKYRQTQLLCRWLFKVPFISHIRYCPCSWIVQLVAVWWFSMDKVGQQQLRCSGKYSQVGAQPRDQEARPLKGWVAKWAPAWCSVEGRKRHIWFQH